MANQSKPVVSIWAAMGCTAPATAVKPANVKPDADVHAVKRIEALLEDDNGYRLGLVSYTESRYDGKVTPAHERVVFFPTLKVKQMIDEATGIVSFPPKNKNGTSFAPFAITEDRLAKASAAWSALQAKKAARMK
jgi:hypothetical protein